MAADDTGLHHCRMALWHVRRAVENTPAPGWIISMDCHMALDWLRRGWAEARNANNRRGMQCIARMRNWIRGYVRRLERSRNASKPAPHGPFSDPHFHQPIGAQ